MASIDISDEEAIIIAEAMRLAKYEDIITDSYSAFNLMQRFKREFPHIDYEFDFFDYDFCNEEDE